MEKWTEIRTAYRLAKLGTLSATAKDIGVHRSTVMRHIDILEEHLKTKLFQRNDKGYIPTEAGLEIMRLGEVTEAQFQQFAAKTQHETTVIKGTLRITCVNEVVQLLMPAIVQYQSEHPEMKVDIIGDTRNFDLEYGEADIALRAGNKPQTLDNIVIPFSTSEIAFCAHRDYIKRHGVPNNSNFKRHHFLALRERIAHLPWNEWMHEQVPEANIKITSTSPQVLNYALLQGQGISIATRSYIENSKDLVQLDIADTWSVNTWLLIHRDMINIPKIRKFVDIAKQNKPGKLEF